jgi:hypothetical protein
MMGVESTYGMEISVASDLPDMTRGGPVMGFIDSSDGKNWASWLHELLMSAAPADQADYTFLRTPCQTRSV